MNIWIWIGIFLLLNIIVLFMYCVLQGKMDNRSNKGQQKNEQQKSHDKEEVSIYKRAYRWLNAYLYGWCRYNIILVGKIPSNRIRRLFYKYIFRMKISKGTVIGGGCEFRSPWNIVIGNSTIAWKCILDGRNGIKIGDNVVFGTSVHVWTAEHDLNDPYFRVLEHNKKPVEIDDRAWICSDSTLLPGVHVYEGAVVAARACVTKDCEDYGVYGGVPAKYLNARNRDLKYKLSGKPTWHFY